MHTLQLGLYKIVFHCKAFAHRSLIVLLPPPTCIAHAIAILLHGYCTIYDPPPTPFLFAVHHTLLLVSISCK